MLTIPHLKKILLQNVTRGLGLARLSEHGNIRPGSAERAERLSDYQEALCFIAFLSRFCYTAQTCLGEDRRNQKSYAVVPNNFQKKKNSRCIHVLSQACSDRSEVRSIIVRSCDVIFSLRVITSCEKKYCCVI
jgi:hypothetical protein